MAEPDAHRDYAGYLAALHRGRNTPAAVIAAAVRAATGSEPATTARIVTGEVNEVYDITTQRGQAVIVRLSAEYGNLLLKERWAIEAARSAGVPVPAVLYTDTLTVEGKPLTISIQRKLAGLSLDNRPARAADEDRRFVKRVVVAAGRVLSTIHSVRTAGFGYLNPNGDGMYQTRSDILCRRLERREPCRDVARRHGFDEGVVERSIEQIGRHVNCVTECGPRLVHGDFGPKHIFVEGERITGIIDWGEAKSDDPVDDFAWWNYFYRAAAPLAWLIEGYEDRSLFDPTFDRRLQIAQLCLGLSCLEYYGGQGYLSGVEFSMRNLAETLATFG